MIGPAADLWGRMGRLQSRAGELLRQKNAPGDILTVCYEPVTGSHVGPGTLALFFLGGDDVRSR